MAETYEPLTLDLHPLELVPHVGTIEERFEAFHAANEHVYRNLVAIARDLRQRGHRRIGMKLCFEVLRWSYLRTESTDGFVLNNSFSSRYSRLIARQEPDLADAFEQRALHAA
jgi:hypothetical protein